MKRDFLKKFISNSILETKAYKPPTNRRNFVKLDLNESYYFLNEEIISELKKFDYFTLSSYPEYGELSADIARYADCRPDNVCVTSGSDQAIQMLLQLFFHKGDEVVVPSPTFFVYFSILELVGAKLKPVLYKEEKNKFVFPFEETLTSLTPDSKGLLLCNPNNPLGSSISENDLVRLLDKARDLNIPVIIDEAYAEFSGYSAAKFLELYENLIIIRSFSKSFGLSGLRLGYVLAHEDIINELVKLRLPWAVNHFAVYAGRVVLKYKKYFEDKIKEVLSIKSKLIKFLRNQNILCYETDTNFILVKDEHHKELIEKLKTKNILVNDVSRYPHAGSLLENTMRLNTPSEADLVKVESFFMGINR